MLANRKSFSSIKKHLSVLVGVIFLFFLVGFISTNANQNITKCSLNRVVDGDTIIVDANNEQFKVRFLGINAPESVNPNESANSKEGLASSNYLKTIISPGQTLYLERDPYQNDADKYRRLLRYVWTENPLSTKNFDNLLNYKIIRNGYAELNFYGNSKSLYYSKLKEAQDNWNNSIVVEYIDAH